MLHILYIVELYSPWRGLRILCIWCVCLNTQRDDDACLGDNLCKLIVTKINLYIFNVLTKALANMRVEVNLRACFRLFYVLMHAMMI